MKCIRLALAIILSSAFTQVTAQDYNKGWEAALVGDFATALQEWKPLAEQGDARAQVSLGFMYDNGNGVLKDATEAVKWYRLAAEQGDADLQNSLGLMYQNGNGILKDYTESLKWHRLASEQGDADGHYFLGHMYANGSGVLQDNIAAHMWYNIASANGHEKAGGYRDEREGLMTASDISKAIDMARNCMNSKYKNCDW